LIDQSSELNDNKLVFFNKLTWLEHQAVIVEVNFARNMTGMNIGNKK
jgi:hypothetical protein